MTTPQAGEIARAISPGAACASLFQATARLEAVIAAAGVIDPWWADVQDALRDCTAAVLYHLETLEADDGVKEQARYDEPRLISRIEALDAALRDLLTEVADARRSTAESMHALVGPLARLVGDLREAAIGEIDILHETLISTGSGD